MFKEFDKRFTINGRELARVRRKLDVTQSRFAYLCKWSGPYQWRIEHGHVRTVSEATHNVIIGVLTELGYKK